MGRQLGRPAASSSCAATARVKSVAWRRSTGANLTLDEPFSEPPDSTSELAVSQYQGHYLLVDNQFTDCGPVQFYGTGIENIVAGNTGTRMQGFKSFGIDYFGVQPCMRDQFLGNKLSEDYYHWTNATDTVMELMAQKPGWNQASVLRNNVLSDDACIRLQQVTDSLVEKKRDQRHRHRHLRHEDVRGCADRQQ